MLNKKIITGLIKKSINWKLDRIIIKHKELTLAHDGMVCQKCGTKQGSSMNGFEHFYCEHLTKSIDELLKKEKTLIAKDIFLVTN